MTTWRRSSPVVGLVPRTYRHSPDCGIFRTEVELFRGCVVLHLREPKRPQVGGGRRGAVTTFSRRSRRSLLRLVASSGSPPGWMVTLTYQGEPTWSEAKDDLRRWVQALGRVAARAGCRCAVVWRAEATRAGRPHFHCLVWLEGPPGARLVPRLSRGSLEVGQGEYSRLRRAHAPGRKRPHARWCDMTAAASVLWVRQSQRRGGEVSALLKRSVDVTSLAGARQAVYYAAKYAAKVAPGGRVEGADAARAVQGRHWGKGGNRELLAPQAWARCTVPNLPGRIEGLAQELADGGWPAVSDLVASRLRTIVAFALDGARADLWALLSRWAVPKLSRPPPACHHTRCGGLLVKEALAF